MDLQPMPAPTDLSSVPVTDERSGQQRYSAGLASARQIGLAAVHAKSKLTEPVADRVSVFAFLQARFGFLCEIDGYVWISQLFREMSNNPMYQIKAVNWDFAEPNA